MIKVFISSPVGSLINERQAAKEAIIELGMDPVLSEDTMPAQSRPSKEACERAVSDCHVYILLLGNDYGYEFEENLSVTHFEFNTARRLDKPILVFNLPGVKEDKQKKFQEIVGGFKDGFFWKSIPDDDHVIKLKAEIRKAILNDYEYRFRDIIISHDKRFADVTWNFFISRPDIVNTIHDKLLKNSTRLLTITGSGGIGKTAIVNEIARQQMTKNNFPDGIYILLCENIESAQILFGEILEKLGLDQAQIKTVEQLAKRIRDKRILIIFDNFETLLYADNEKTVKFIEDLIHYSYLPKLLLTSRETCQVNEELVVDLPRMELKESRELFNSILENCGVNIDNNYTSLSDSLLEEMDGVPLAIILCASLLQWYSPNDLIEEWKINSRILSKPGQKEGRLNSVDFSLNLSFNKLNDDEQLFLSVLSLFAGGATEEAINSVFDKPASGLIAPLKQRHLVYSENKRLKMLEPIRRFAGIKWKEEEEKKKYITAFVLYYSRQVNNWYDNLNNNLGGVVLPLFKSEYENVFIASMMIINELKKKSYNQLINMAFYSANLWGWTGLSYWGIEFIKMGVKAAIETGDRLGEADCHKRLGGLYFLIYDNEKARIEFERTLPLYKEVGSKLGEANCYQSLGNLYFRTSDNEKARMEFERALTLYKEIGSKLGEANCYLRLGDLYFLTSDNEKARLKFERALHLYKEVGSKLGEGNCYQSLGDLYFRTYDNEKARLEFERALHLYKVVGDKLGEGNCYQSLGDLYFRTFDDEKAMLEFERALPLYKEVGNKLGVASCYQSLGGLYFRTSDNEKTRLEFERALHLYKEAGHKLGEADCYQSIGNLYFRTSDNEKARLEFERALHLYKEVGSKLGEANCHKSLGDLYFRTSDNEKAMLEFERALHLYKEAGDKLGKANCYQSLGDLYFRTSDNEKARLEFERALSIYKEVGDKLGEANYLFNIGVYNIRTNKEKEGIKMAEKSIKYYESLPHYYNAAFVLQTLSNEAKNISKKIKIEWLTKAAKYYLLIDLHADAKKCKEKIAQLNKKE